MNQPADELERLAAGIADDERVDWRLLARLSERDAKTGGGLVELSHLARAFRQADLAPAAPRAPRGKFDKLEILEPLGAGAQGEVFRAYDPMLDAEVALKLKRADTDALNHRFLEEARRLAKIRHGNVLSVFGAAVEDGRAGIWTELVRGQSLADRLALAGRLDHEEAVEIALQVAAALGAVHRHGVVHGDVKATNVMVENGGRVVLMDFGAAREAGASNDSGVISGTPHYLAPELLEGAAPSAATDLYALGVLLYHLLSGEYPYPPELARSADRAARSRERRPLARLVPSLPKRLVAEVEAAIDPDASNRPPSAADLARRLRASLAPAAPRRWPWLAAGAAAAALLVLALARTVFAPGFAPGIALYRVAAGGEAQLADGARVAIGDRLALKLALDRDAWVYVLADDGRGNAVVLHPLAAADNPLHAGASQRLPRARDGAPLAWQVDSEAEAEEFLVAIGDRPLAALDSLSTAWRAPAQSAVVPRGTASVVAAPEAVSSVALKDLAARLEPEVAAGHARLAQYRLPHRE